MVPEGLFLRSGELLATLHVGKITKITAFAPLANAEVPILFSEKKPFESHSLMFFSHFVICLVNF